MYSERHNIDIERFRRRIARDLAGIPCRSDEIQYDFVRDAERNGFDYDVMVEEVSRKLQGIVDERLDEETWDLVDESP